MSAINPYITFNGNCEEAFNFYKSVFGGEFPYLGRFKDMPPMEGAQKVSDEEGEKIMHVSLPIGDSILMGSDVSEAFCQPNVVLGSNIAISINATSREEADRISKALSEGGQMIMPMADTFWGAYFGQWVDKFGINWMMNYDKPTE